LNFDVELDSSLLENGNAFDVISDLDELAKGEGFFLFKLRVDVGKNGKKCSYFNS
jgi:hypothetical protein